MNDAEIVNIILANGGAVAIAGLVVWRLAASIDRFTTKVDEFALLLRENVTDNTRRIAKLEEETRSAQRG